MTTTNSYGFVGHCTGTFESRLSYHDIEGAHPATKEQRDLLFQKMKEAGYEWDEEKKELKRIEQVDGFDAELKESEGEKIRTGLINGFKQCLKNSLYPKNAQKYWHDIKIEDILAWLQKQGEQKAILDELEMTLSVSEDAYLGSNIGKLIKELKRRNNNESK